MANIYNPYKDTDPCNDLNRIAYKLQKELLTEKEKKVAFKLSMIPSYKDKCFSVVFYNTSYTALRSWLQQVKFILKLCGIDNGEIENKQQQYLGQKCTKFIELFL